MQADIFFFVTTVSVVLITAVVLWGGYYLVGILRDVRAICARVRKASETVEQDFESLRAQVKTEGMKLRGIVDVLIGFLTYRFGAPRKRKKSAEQTVSE